jgi:hypothetical protein
VWLDLLKSIVPDSVLILAVAWLAKAITTHRLTKDVESFKTNLAIEASRDNTVFSRLHERRVLVIAEVYAALVSAESAVAHYITKMGAPTPPEGKTLTDVALAAMWKLVDAVDTHRIWFTPATAGKLDEVVVALRRSWNLSAIGDRHSNNQNERVLAMVEDAYRLLTEKVPELRATVEEEFRALLAVELRPKLRPGVNNP